MAVIQVLEDWRSHSADHSKYRTYERSFIVRFNDTHDGGATAIAVVGQQFGAAYGAPYSRGGTEIDGAAICRKITAKPYEDNPYTMQVVAEYSNEPESGDNQEPLARPIEIRWGLNKTTRPMDKTVNGDAVVNSAKEAFEEPVEIDDSRLVLQYVRNEASFNPHIALDFKDAINSTTWNGFEPRKVKVSNLGAELQVEGFFVFWRVTYEFEFQERENGWLIEVLDRGYSELVAGQRVEIQDANGMTPSKPHLLSGGTKTSTPAWLEFEGYEEKSFGPLNITLP